MLAHMRLRGGRLLRSSAGDTSTRCCARNVLCSLAFPPAPVLGSAHSSAGPPASFAGFTATITGPDFSCPFISGYGSSPSQSGPARRNPPGRTRDLPASGTILLYVMGSSTTAERRRHRIAAPHMLPSAPSTASASASFRLSRLYNPPHTIAVYASPQPSPADMQHSLTGARYGLPAPVFHRLDRASLPGALRARAGLALQTLTLTRCAGLSLSRKR